MDVVIIGAGPSGATAALNLAPFRKVLLVDAGTPAPRIGESLPGAARRLLSDMGLLDDFVRDRHLPRTLLRSIWGGAAPIERDALADPDGHGWQLDRARFEQQLRAVAIMRGASVASPARVAAIDRQDNGWRVTLRNGRHSAIVACKLIIDASGRRSRHLLAHGARRHVNDKLSCAWLRAPHTQANGTILIEAEADGWWYAASVPGGEAVLAFHTDADLAAARSMRSAASLLQRAREKPMLAAFAAGFAPGAFDHGICTAHGSWLAQPFGDGWIATGDAAMSSDPLSAQGLFAALYFGLAAAQTADRNLGGDADAMADYACDYKRVRTAIQKQQHAFYGLETRWTDRDFWQRRSAAR